MSGRGAGVAGVAWERMTQVAIMLAIGGAAGAASFTHVHDVAAAHGQDGWLAWADAVVLELMSIASGLEMRRRKRAKVSVRFPAVVLAVAVFLSLGAQVVDAERSVIGWIAAAIPALGFLVMVKVALAQGGGPSTVSMAPSPEIAAPSPDPAPVVDAPVADAAPPPLAVVEHRDDAILMTAARSAADALDREGHRVSRQALAVALRANGHAVSNARASALLRALKAEASGDDPQAAEHRRRFRPQPRNALADRSA